MILLNDAANGTTGASKPIGQAGNKWRGNAQITYYLSGTLGSGGTVEIEGSPDQWYQAAQGPGSVAQGVTDANSRWFTVQTMTALGFVTDTNVYRKVRAVVSAGDGTTSLTLEAVGA